MIGTNVFVGSNNIKKSGSESKTFLLDRDFASGATAAYALRLLREKHQGGLIRTRADSSGVNKGEADVLPKLQPDGSKIITLDSLIENLNSTAQNRLGTNQGGGNNTLADLVETGTNNFSGFIPTWYEQTPNINNASNSTASQQPQIVSSGSVVKENGEPALEFDGSSAVLLANTNDITYSALSWFVIFSIDYSNSDSFARIVTHTKGATKDFKLNGNLLGAVRENGNLKLRTQTRSVLYSYSAPDDQQIINTTIGNNNQPFIKDFLDGGKVGETFNENFGTTVDKIIIGSNRNVYLAGKINEAILYYSDKLSERSNIETNINNHYSIF